MDSPQFFILKPSLKLKNSRSQAEVLWLGVLISIETIIKTIEANQIYLNNIIFKGYVGKE